jgi:hypothetical protein
MLIAVILHSNDFAEINTQLLCDITVPNLFELALKAGLKPLL